MRDDATQVEAVLISMQQVAQRLACSLRHVQRLRDAGKMPPPVRLGTLTRWNRAVIDQWIADGCPDLRKHSALKNRANTP
ncbi:MAG: helix-turn-helix domain-containing protein [Planctomycetes bacterium]|nr:helix-turn-helix domain-containing protein [Planctomycetota bacterium]